MDKKNFKIAVQLFGHLRTYKECYQSLKEYLLDKESDNDELKKILISTIEEG